MLFHLIQHGGKVSEAEMYQVFNMGIGMVLVVPATRAAETVRLTRGIPIGEITKGPQDVVFD